MQSHWNRQVDNIDLGAKKAVGEKERKKKHNRVKWNVRHLCAGDVEYRNFEAAMCKNVLSREQHEKHENK